MAWNRPGKHSLIACAAAVMFASAPRPVSEPLLPAYRASPAYHLVEQTRDEDLLILDGNAWMVPFISPHLDIRFTMIIDYIRSLPQQPDIIAFQEVWRQSYVERFAEALPGYAIFTSGNERNLGLKINRSGLVTLVRDELLVSDVTYKSVFGEKAASFSELADKGALTVAFEHHGNEYRITNIHLPMTHRGTLTERTRRIFDAMDLDGIIVGDLNLRPQDLPEHFPVLDTTPTFRNERYPGRVREARIDYVIPEPGMAAVSEVVTADDGRCLPFSDHCFIVARIMPEH